MLEVHNHTGEILIQCDSVFCGYYKNPEATATALEDGWLHTGDAGMLDDEGHLVMIDRLKDVLQLADGAYFRTLAIPLVDGRVFEEADRQRVPVAVVAASAAARIWPGQNAIGKRFRIGPDTSPLIEILGIVGHVRGVSLESGPRPSVYLPY